MSKVTTIEDVLNKHFGKVNLAWLKHDFPMDYDSLKAAMQEWASLQTPSNEKYGWVDGSIRLPEYESKKYFIRWKHRLTKDDEWEVLFATPSAMVDPKYWKLEWLDESTPIPIQTPCVELEKEVERLKGLIENELRPSYIQDQYLMNVDYTTAQNASMIAQQNWNKFKIRFNL